MFIVDRHQGLIPDLIKHRHRVGVAVLLLQAGNALAEMISNGKALDLSAGQGGKAFNGGGHRLEASRLNGKHRHTKIFQRLDLLRRVAGNPANHQVGLKGDQTLHVYTGMAANGGNIPGGGRIIAVRNHRHHLIPCTGCPDQFRCAGGKRRNAAGRLVQADFLAGGVNGTDSVCPGRQPE